MRIIVFVLYMLRNAEALSLSFRVRENQAGAMVGQLTRRAPSRRTINSSTDTVLTTGAAIRNQKFIIVNQPELQNRFAVSQDGTIYTQQPLDREERVNYQLTILAESGKRVIRSLYHVRIACDRAYPPLYSFSNTIY